MKQESRCRCCGDPVDDIRKKFDTDLGFICRSCHAAANDQRLRNTLRDAGIVGTTKEDVP